MPRTYKKLSSTMVNFLHRKYKKGTGWSIAKLANYAKCSPQTVRNKLGLPSAYQYK